MLKTPVSILQELAVRNKLPFPEYTVSGSGQSHMMSFTCNVQLGDKTDIGTGTTKKDAKHNAASRLLEKYGVNTNSPEKMSDICLLPTKTRKDGPVINFVGKLNEFCSGNRYPQPTYNESGTVANNCEFCITCTLQEFQSAGYGTTKKEAKQDSAKQMLLLLKDETIEHSPLGLNDELNGKNKPGNETIDKVLHAYTSIIQNLSIGKTSPVNDYSQGKTSLVNDYSNDIVSSIKSDKKSFDISSWDELIDYMNKQGWNHEVTVFQSMPLMLRLKINERTFINHGLTRENICKKFVQQVVQMLEEGTDFNEPLLTS